MYQESILYSRGNRKATKRTSFTSPNIHGPQRTRERRNCKGQATNRRDHRYVIDFANPSILIPQKLERIVNSFTNWLNESWKRHQDVRKKFGRTIDKILEEVRSPVGMSESTFSDMNKFITSIRNRYTYYYLLPWFWGL